MSWRSVVTVAWRRGVKRVVPGRICLIQFAGDLIAQCGAGEKRTWKMTRIAGILLAALFIALLISDSAAMRF
ncbi:protein of unknown function [Hyphomicrobium sp. MC1]|nr:protein of unknown function [Hyphomicrobium sp. MC1]